jgi:4'-phosphopantetheinyl transferase
MIGGIGIDDPLGISMSFARNAVKLFFASIDVRPSVLARLLAVLTSAEADRAARFHHDGDRRRSIVGRAALRHLLSRHFGVEPQAFHFELQENGKPFLRESDIHFNVSHSGEVVAIALAANEVGVDIEAKHRIPEIAAIAARFFSKDEAERVRVATDATDEFLRIWTMKEAVVKGAGQGLGLPLDCFTVPSCALAPRPVIPVGEPPMTADWFVVETEAPGGYYGAVARRGSDWRVVARWLSAEDLVPGITAG